MRVPLRLLTVLHHFDGRPTDEALEALRAREGLELDPALVRRLVDFQLLRPA